jgi:hypothetical protein
MHQPNPDHPTHDLTLVAAHAAGDLTDADRPYTEAQLASCADCADLHRDLILIAAATHSLPTPFARTRDVQLSPEHAERLRRGSWLRAILRPFGATRSAVRPMAAAFTTLGIAGLLVAAALPNLLGGTASLAPELGSTSTTGGLTTGATNAPVFGEYVPAPQAGGASPAAASPVYDRANAVSPAAPYPTDLAVKAGSSAGSDSLVALGAGRSPDTLGSSAAPGTVAGPSPSSLPNLLVIGSGALLAAGLALFGLRFAGRRVR